MRIDPNDLMFAGAGMVWGTLTVVQGVRSWHHRRTLAGAVVAVACLGYLAWSLRRDFSL